jgi:small subunit ribosomal protein S19
MSRSLWKPFFIHPEIDFQKKSNGEENTNILYNRNTLITRDMIGFKFHVYNGIRFISFEVNLDKVGHKLGEFAPTKKKPIPKKKKK